MNDPEPLYNGQFRTEPDHKPLKAKTFGGKRAFATFIRGYQMWHVYIYLYGYGLHLSWNKA